jgi:hypothetical protein
MEKTIVASDFLTKEHYDLVYEAVHEKIENNLKNDLGKYDDGFAVIDNNGFIIYFDVVKDDVVETIREKLEDILHATVALPGVLFARYTRDSGYRPRLRPHVDRAVKRPSLTATIELDTTLDWDIYVNDEKYNLEKNQILLFSGSKDVHWRPDIEFKDDDYFDVIILQTYIEDDDDTVLEDSYFDEMDKISGQFIEKYKHLLERSLNDELNRI